MMKALFMDRDGTINVDYGYVHRVEDFHLIDGVLDFCKTACTKGYGIIVITNQSGISRGYFSRADYALVTEHMRKLFSYAGIDLLDVFHCEELSGPLRKPAPGMFLLARDKYGIDMASSINIGDSQRDIDAGLAAGVGRNILFNGSYVGLADLL